MPNRRLSLELLRRAKAGLSCNSLCFDVDDRGFRLHFLWLTARLIEKTEHVNPIRWLIENWNRYALRQNSTVSEETPVSTKSFVSCEP
jgi:hypothetical protein